MTSDHLFLDILSSVVGWIYFFAWSISFYGQLYENWKHRSVEGYKLDYQILNMISFFYYSLYTWYGYLNTGSQVGTVDVSDVVFASHAFLILCLTGIQCIIYPKGANRISFSGALIAFMILAQTIAYGLLTGLGVVENQVNVWVFLGIGKVMISFLKYIFPFIYNCRRGNTIGWSILNIILDFTGGSFSFMQIVVDHLRNESDGTFSGTLNIAKFGLSVESIFYDILFMLQHYVIFRAANKRILAAHKKGKELFDDEPEVPEISENGPDYAKQD